MKFEVLCGPTGLPRQPRPRQAVTVAQEAGLHLVRVRFGSHLISEWTGPADEAEQLAEQQRKMFSRTCCVTVEPITPAEPVQATAGHPA